MKIVVQKVKKCVLYSDGKKFSEIGAGMLVLLGVSATDQIEMAKKMAQTIFITR